MDYDVLVIGSGFGGSVTALRLTEKGYRVGVLEAGRRFDDPDGAPGRRHQDLPKTSWRTRRYLWAPGLGMTGIQRIHLLRGERGSRVLVLAGAGVGGGSLVYANTLYEPPQPFFDDPQWRHITDWKAELRPYYDQARRMLGVRTNPTMTPADRAIKRVADRMGRGDTFHLTPVGVLFGDKPGAPVDDPYFGGAGPRRVTCTECGSCMTGCRVGAKNMLTENYLYLAEHAGAKVISMATVTAVRPRPGGGYEVEITRTGRRGARWRRTLTAEQVVLSAGTYGTQRLLHRMKATGALPHLSDRLGVRTRTNSEAILGVERFRARGEDHSRGLAITSSFHPDEHTHIEPTRYGPGSNAMGGLRSLLIDGGGRVPRWARFLGQLVTHPWDLVRLPNLRNWSRRTIIALVMQTNDNSITVEPSPSGRGLRARRGHGEPNPTWIPQAHRAVRMLAEEIGGFPGGTWLDLFNIPTTAHFIGGCTIGNSPEEGVIDPYHRVYGHPGLHVVDGSTVSANLGVNPSLTITAQAERAMAFWPNRGEPDSRPDLGTPYTRLTPVAPKNPAVPADAPAALHLPTTPA
ncbi:GMC oxidoreductase [Actinoallomurus rhizosphaericola]|uniref:GMC oxidoreductase n=1 Tax=Actinoallomurus rhizosphaericola TaxID=2952536 RepID=UPI002093A727|nr:GMC family oxidoreductase [Actinoallomurus rhizosphaericola]MCO5999141.1 GMC family oxidoreductase [Actinoallomurus rhizosphaericola]